MATKEVRKMNFRQALAADIEVIKDVIFSVLKEYGLQPDPGETDKDLNDLNQFYFSKGGYFEVCEIEGNIVGSWGLYHLNEHSCELRKMYLKSNQRGKGLGTMMISRAIKKAHDLGFKRVELETASVLKEAIGLYQKYGFKPVTGKHLAQRCDQAFELYL